MLTSPLALIGPIGWVEAIIIGMVGLLIFGRRLPEVGKGLGKSIVEFKKGLAGIEDELDVSAKAAASGPSSVVVDNQRPAIDRHDAAAAEAVVEPEAEKASA